MFIAINAHNWHYRPNAALRGIIERQFAGSKSVEIPYQREISTPIARCLLTN